MPNTPWDTGSGLYRRLVISALLITGAGILLAILGAATTSPAVSATALPVIVAGLVTHVAGLVIRTRDARRRQQGTRNTQ